MRSNLSLQVKATDILAECDKLRDITLPDLGVRLEDKEGEKTVIKLVDKEELRKEREEKLALEEKKAGGQLHSNRLYIGLDESFHSVVVITCASHAQGRRFKPGWKQTYFSSFVSLPFVADVYDTH